MLVTALLMLLPFWRREPTLFYGVPPELDTIATTTAPKLGTPRHSPLASRSIVQCRPVKCEALGAQLIAISWSPLRLLQRLGVGTTQFVWT